jgi:hypothetical protein
MAIGKFNPFLNLNQNLSLPLLHHPLAPATWPSRMR